MKLLNNRKLFTTLAGVLLAGTMASAQAIPTVTLSPNAGSYGVGDTVTVSFTLDTSTGDTLGGGTDFFWDASVLSFVGWSFDAGFTQRDTSFDRQPDDCSTSGNIACTGPGEANGMGFGNFGGFGSGQFLVGTLTFTAISIGVTDIFMGQNEDSPGGPGEVGNAGPWRAADGSATDVTFNGANVQVVPIPAAAWLMISGLGLLGGLRRFG